MSEDSKRLESMIGDLIGIVGKTNSMVVGLTEKLNALVTDVNDIKNTVYRIEHRLNVMEKRQDRLVARVDVIEAESDLHGDN